MIISIGLTIAVSGTLDVRLTANIHLCPISGCVLNVQFCTLVASWPAWWTVVSHSPAWDTTVE